MQDLLALSTVWASKSGFHSRLTWVVNLESGGEGVGGGSFHGRELMRVYGRHPAPLKSMELQ